MAKVLDEEQSLAINPGMVLDEFLAFPGQLSYFGERYALAVAKAAALKEQLKDVEAEVYLALRANKEPGQTEAQLAAMVRVHPKVKLTRDMLLAADAAEVRMKEKVMLPMYAKKEMLISIGAHQRAELSGDPMIKHARRDDLAEIEGRVFGK